jgi:FAD/FMN-containing dehydrogenase
MTLTPSDLFQPLRARLTGSLVIGSDGYWDVSRAAWVLDAPPRPSAVVHATTSEDVAATVRFAAEHGLRVVRRSADRTPAPSGETLLLTVS